ncbi:DUF6221 family protein [Streptomyces rubrogriseus]|uniref:DUF6221 family protein n=1 Tax=Streptomyces rubrogriseus TaxID=194673 RepID=UPI000D5999B5|nr:DUF6221 family protein [Streptomyces rubrogriseus]
MSDIADFLRARYAEQRALALAASPGPWQANDEHDEVIAVDGITVAEGFALSGRQLRATVDHIAAHNPTAVIADLDAKLAIVDLMDRTLVAAEGDTEVDHYAGLSAAEETLCRLAQPFVEHPDHKGEEWAP